MARIFNIKTVIDQPHVFALISKHRTIIGIEPETIVQSWRQAKHYYGKRWMIGWLGYEQGYPFMRPPKNSPLQQSKDDLVKLPDVYFGVFKKVIIVDNINIPKFSAKGGSASGGHIPLRWKPTLTKKQYLQKIAILKKHITQGDIYQANLSYRFTTSYPQHPFELFKHLYHQQLTSYAAYIHTPKYSVSSVSPELFLDIKHGLVETHPMKGTLLRSSKKSILHNSAKDKAELDMIIDVHRNDLARTAIPGSVHVKHRRRIRAFPTVWQADAVIQSRIAKPYTSLDVIETMFPAGSITGAPKLRAMEILHNLEPQRRNIYTGSIGYIAPNGDATFNVAIRTAYTINQQAHYHVGGGIVFDSQAEAEYLETRNKAKIILE